MRYRSTLLTLMTEICALLSRVTIAVMKHHDQVNLRRKGLICLDFTSVIITEESQDSKSNRSETQKQEKMQKQWRGAAYLFVLHGSLSTFFFFFIEYKTTSIGTAKQ